MTAGPFVTMPLLRWWANLSGDYNPVHFQEEAARQAGSASIFAHGLLVFQVAVLQLSDLPALAGDGPVAWKADFRAPAPIDTNIRAQFDEATGRFSVVADATAKPIISGRYANEPPLDEDPGSALWRIEVPRREIDDAHRSIREMLSSSAPPWFALQAVSFARYYKTLDLSALSGRTVLQTRHEVRLPGRAPCESRAASADVFTLECNSQDVVSVGDRTMVATRTTLREASIPVLQMLMEVLLTKTRSTAA
jgi:hypothetical protein